ncbi:Cof-type HAD-IIB family hydrolase [Enterococcus alishanensis]|uniref:Cof-type HAD-IIB family hydrolase n=1 Tax=Enterococcus alishanensis TaxID=1303817 RepID=A0ABS6T9A6_9ENTE|nr:Cof-type HAD-IIB family hydrolase [Enterococcus alishanensis]MBV7389470.1 Cof-type HAD-IIB family hydrolase [Enterococcus alishanensis]
MIKLIASDMDGTLLNHQMQISEENITAINNALDKGLKFITATGRGIIHAERALNPTAIRVPMILLNGAQIVNQDRETVYTAAIPQDLAFSVLNHLNDQAIYAEVFTAEHVYSENQAVREAFLNQNVLDHAPDLTPEELAVQVANVIEELHTDFVPDIQAELIKTQEEVLKIIAFDKNGAEILEKVSADLADLGDLAITASDSTNLEINHKNAQKGVALAHYAQQFDFTSDEIMAIGDNYNDISMLKYAGTSFAMGNAELPVKEVAKFETATNEESGVALAIQQILSE